MPLDSVFLRWFTLSANGLLLNLKAAAERTKDVHSYREVWIVDSLGVATRLL